ncbi:MAG TPA: 4Fe-4S binding protein [Anaerolineaceae bacterium]|nr:4Fe-4S binding protein [Anaerolineaceae bacterium]
MNGTGIIKGLAVTIRHFFSTYFADQFGLGRAKAKRGTMMAEGLFTVQYPEESVTVPEEFRVIPFLVYTIEEDGQKKYRCTACGICAKVCPTQCIWITRMKNEETGKPVPESAEFYIDIDKCMNCGSCAEFCPFDAIKMDHDFRIASYTRGESHIYNKERLGKPLEYYAKIRPTNYAQEEAQRAAKAQAG